MSTDPIHELVHDHADLNRRVLELGAVVAQLRPDRDASLVGLLSDLREHLFLHFAREEEGLFPFVAEQLPELADQVGAMAVAHDTICGAVARMVHQSTVDPTPRVLRALYERFEQAYATHARNEAELLQRLDGGLDPAQRTQLAELVRGL